MSEFEGQDHAVLDVIERALIDDPGVDEVVRGVDCVEFYDPATSRWYEVVVRPIPMDQEDEAMDS